MTSGQWGVMDLLHINNGKSWKTFEEVSLATGNYLGLAVKGNIVVMTGNEGNKAAITIGKRN